MKEGWLVLQCSPGLKKQNPATFTSKSSSQCLFEGNSKASCHFRGRQGEEKTKFNAATYARGGPHLTAGVHSCWHFQLVIHQQGLNYLVNIVLLHSHIMPAWFHHNNIPVIILAAVKNKSSKKCEIMKALIAFLPGSRVAMHCTPAAHTDNTGFVLVLVYCCTPTCSNKWESFFILLKRWLNLLVFGVHGRLIAIKWRNNYVCCFHWVLWTAEKLGNLNNCLHEIKQQWERCCGINWQW